jgi:hypothetical protein
VLVAGAPGWAVAVATNGHPPPCEPGPRRALREALWGIIAGTERARHEAHACVLVDARFGREVPMTRCGALDLAVRIRAQRLVWSGEEMTITSESARERELASRVTLAPGISRTEIGNDGALVAEFRRCLAPVEVPAELAPLVTDARGEPVVRDLIRARGTAALRGLRALEAAHVLTLVGPSRHICTQDTCGEQHECSRAAREDRFKGPRTVGP